MLEFLWLPCWHHKKKRRQQACFCRWTLQIGRTVSMSFQVSILTGLIGWPVLWYLISCVMQIKWHWLPLNSSSDNALHLPQVPLSLESGHTQATSHCKESNLIPSSSFQSGIWNVWGRHKGCSCGLMHTTRGTVSMSTDWVGILGILDFLEVGGGFLWLPGWYHSTIRRHQGCTWYVPW